MSTRDEFADMVNHRRLNMPKFSLPEGRAWFKVVLLIVLLCGLYYPIGMMISHKVDDEVSYTVPVEQVTSGGSHAVDVTAALIEREVSLHGWTANDPFWMPTAALDNMPNYQQGMVGAFARFAFELTDQIGRTRGSSQTDKDLQEAAGLLQYSGTKWLFDFSTSIAPTATSEAQYRKARKALLSYNKRLVDGNAVFERRSDNLLATLDRIALDIGSASAVLEKQLREGNAVFNFESDDVFYGVKGQMYGYYMILKALSVDFENVIRERDLVAAYTQMLDSFEQAARMDPLVVLNGSPDSTILPSHLAGLGFYTLRARTQLREITNILLK